MFLVELAGLCSGQRLQNSYVWSAQDENLRRSSLIGRERVIQLLDRVTCDDLDKTIVKAAALKRAVLVQDAEDRDDLFALLHVDDQRAVLVRSGNMSLQSTDTGQRKLLAFRNELDRCDISPRELRFCQSGTYNAVWDKPMFDPACFVPVGADLAQRFASWRAGRAEW